LTEIWGGIQKKELYTRNFTHILRGMDQWYERYVCCVRTICEH
jgi:hypothetical protein